MDHTHQRQEELNKNGGPEAKGGQAPQSEYAKVCKMRVGLVHKLATSPQENPIQGIAGNTNAFGYVVINVQIGGIHSYNEEQVTLVIEDISSLGMRVPVILGMPTIHRLCHQMKESEIESTPDEWQLPSVPMRHHKAYSYKQ